MVDTTEINRGKRLQLILAKVKEDETGGWNHRTIANYIGK